MPITMPTTITNLKLQIKPLNPEYEHATASLSILTVNPLTFMMVFLAYTAVITVRLGSTKRFIKNIYRRTIAQKELLTTTKPKLVSAKLELNPLEVYHRACLHIYRKTGLSIKPQTTLREYLSLVENSNAFTSHELLAFRRITYLIEKFLYSQEPLTSHDMQDLLRCLKTLEESA